MSKRVIFSAIIAMCVVLGLVSCKKNPVEAFEIVSGKVTNEEGQALNGIQISKFLDQELKDLVLVTLTKEDGTYNMNDVSKYVANEGMDTVLIYLVAEDLQDVYERKVVETQMIYNPSSSIGSSNADIVMKKK